MNRINAISTSRIHTHTHTDMNMKSRVCITFSHSSLDPLASYSALCARVKTHTKSHTSHFHATLQHASRVTACSPVRHAFTRTEAVLHRAAAPNAAGFST